MLDLIARDFPRLIAALRRVHGIGADDAAGLILAARYPGRAGVWTVTDCERAGRLIRGAFVRRPRTLRGAL